MYVIAGRVLNLVPLAACHLETLLQWRNSEDYISYCTNRRNVDVYEYNNSSRSPLLRAGFTEEGRFKEHRYWEGKRWDVYRLAFYRRQLEDVKDLISRAETD